MTTFLIVGAAALIVYSLISIRGRPGLLAGLIVSSLGLAPLVGNMGAALGIVATIIGLYELSKKGFRLLPAEFFLLIWACFMAVTVLWSLDSNATFTELAEMIFLDFGTYLYCRAYAGRAGFLRDFMISTAIINALCFAMLARTLTGTRLGGENSAWSPVGIATLPEIGIIGSVAMILFWQGLSNWWRLALALLTLGLFIPFAIGTGTRTVLISVSVVIVVYVTWLAVHGRMKVIAAMMATVAAVGAGTAIILPQILGPVASLVLTATFGRVLSAASSDTVDFSALSRLDFYQQALSMFTDMPLSGHGVASFGYMADGMFAAGLFPHNMILELLVDGGLVGATLFMLFLIPMGYEAIKRFWVPDLSWQAAVIAGLFISTLIRHQLSLSIMTGKLLFFSLGCIAAWVV